MSEQMTFIDRLERIADGRKLYPWLMALGLSSATIARMRKGKIPGIDQLIMITRAECVNLDWLVNGYGHPYLVVPAESDDELAGEIYDLRDAEWDVIYPVSDQSGVRALVVATPMQMEWNGSEVNYTEMVIATGPIGARTMEAIQDWCLDSAVRCYPNTMSRGQAADVVGGRLGTWQLLDSPGHLLQKTDPGHAAELQSAYSTVEDPPTVQDVADMMRVLSPELQERVKAYVEGMTDAVDSVTGDEGSGK